MKISEQPLPAAMAEEPLLINNNIPVTDLIGEVCKIAMPMILVLVSQQMLRNASIMMVGHYDHHALSAAAVATSLTNVTGFSLISGLANAIETVCGQAYGARRYDKVGIFTMGSIIWLLIACLPVTLLWFHIEKLLLFIGLDPLISKEAGNFTIWLIPSLYAYSVLQAIIRYLQIQSLITPIVISTLASVCIHLLVSWCLIFKLEMGNAAAAFSVGLSYAVNAIMLGFYVKYSGNCKKTHVPLTKEVFFTMREFFRFAIPSALMVCLEWWTFEIVILVGGLLPKADVETSVLSICLVITSMHFSVPYSFGAATSTRVSNLIGAGKPKNAQMVLIVVIVMVTIELLMAMTVIFWSRHILGYAFANDEDVVDYVEEMVPLISLSLLIDGLQAVLSGTTRGMGRQNLGAWVNFGAYYIVGLPVAMLLGFVLRLQGKGLWAGLVVGSVVQTVLLAFVAIVTDWNKQAIEA